ncbi:hypothetical protein ROHU_012176 [Labeo rohita]|uniref:Ig-like domain-containing protein n=1 Tax=Labeo rohita TaxID=84645 RepID=A0A498LNF4_LABRO|nr:hypothetical protein ROHU_012176 [Labeo rohita]
MPDGSPMILCSVDFYPDSLEQLWMRDGDVLDSSYSNKTFNGFFNQQSTILSTILSTRAGFNRGSGSGIHHLCGFDSRFDHCRRVNIKDTGTYTCTVRRIAKPPQMDLGVERVQVIVRPILSLSCVKRPDGSPMILCSVDFYPDSLEQLWITDGDVLNSSYSNKSFDGSFKQQSYLILPPQTLNDTIYSCWVNHSSLNKPLVANLSSFVCYENGGIAVTVTVVFVMLTVVLTIFLITPVICRHYIPPNVSVSHEGALGEFPTIVCRSEGFYPSALEQMWMRNGEFQNASLTYSINKTNPDGSFTLHSFLNTSDCVNYSCWVNHSTLSQPTILTLTPADCYENRDWYKENGWIVFVTSALFFLTILIIMIVCECSIDIIKV